jgi:hypothetical protein
MYSGTWRLRVSFRVLLVCLHMYVYAGRRAVIHNVVFQTTIRIRENRVYTCFFKCIIPAVLYAKKGRLRSVKTQLIYVLFCLLCSRRHVSAVVGHLQVTKLYHKEKLYMLQVLVVVQIHSL